MHLILKYFPDLNSFQKKKFEFLDKLYRDWNSKINVISRKDIDSLYEKHVLHSLAIAKVISFKKNSKIIDIGTGGGFPGIPLAIIFPECKFTLIDSIGKKIKVVEEISNALELSNVEALKYRSNEFKGKFDFIISRAVSSFPEFYNDTQHLISGISPNNGILYLKGGVLQEELKDYKNKISIFEIHNFFEEEFFETKKVIYYRGV
jgi:16S rRNA (guanine527-N7)-methyltransferase